MKLISILFFGSVVLIFFSILINLLIAKIINLISDQNSSRLGNPSKMKVNLGESARNLLLFLQISDIHLSKWKEPERATDFFEFCSTTVNTIKPEVVIASGDLTDAKNQFILGSDQYIEEWKAYHNVLEDTGISNKTIYMDIRGNHDTFNVPFLNSKEDLFMNFSAQGKHHKRSYMEMVEKDDFKYSFIAIDACMEPGLKRPFNFIGLLTESEINKIQKMTETSKENSTDYNLKTIWFAHYPTSSILSAIGQPSIRKIVGSVKESTVFLSGHYHTLGGWVKKMYTMHHEGFLELELADFMKNRFYRMAVFDNGMISFTDIKHGTWPAVLITNPKNPMFNLKDELEVQRLSTHIRIVAYSLDKINTCRLRIDLEDFQNCKQITENFFVVKWEAENYTSGKHVIELLVGDEGGRSQVILHDFSLDGSKMSFDVLARLVLMSEINQVFMGMYFAALLLCIGPISFFRCWHFAVTIKEGKISKPKINLRILKQFWILSTIDKIFYWFLFYCVYITIGPWSIHEIIDENMGVVLLWGSFVRGAFLPGTLSYFYGFWQLIFCQFPLSFIFSRIVEMRLNFHLTSPGLRPKKGICTFLFSNLTFFLIIAVETMLAIVYYFQYGFLACLLSPLRFWGVLLNIYLFYLAHNLPPRSLRAAASIWSERKFSTS